MTRSLVGKLFPGVIGVAAALSFPMSAQAAFAASAEANHAATALSHNTVRAVPDYELVWEYDPPAYPGNSTGLSECVAAGRAADLNFAVGYECRLGDPVAGEYGLWLRIKEG